MIRSIIIASTAAMIALPAYAHHYVEDIERSIELKDGSTVHVFDDGKMAMEDEYGRPFLMREGVEMQTQDSEKIVMKGNVMWRLEAWLLEHSGGGG